MAEILDRAELLRRHERRLSLMVQARAEDLGQLPLFSGIPAKARDKVIDKVRKYIHLATLQPGELILREGDYSDSAFYVVAGCVEVMLGSQAARPGASKPVVRGGAHQRQPTTAASAESMLGRAAPGSTVFFEAAPADLAQGDVKVLGAGEIFGEMSALSRYAVSATVRARTEVKLLQIRLPALRMLTSTSKEFKSFLDSRYRERSLALHLSSVELFSRVEHEFIERLKERADLVSFEPGQLIVEEGAPADAFLLVRGGFVKVSVKTGRSDLAVTYLRKGDYAGEAALLIDEIWPFTLQALDHAELVRITKQDFQEITARYPDLEDELWGDAVARLKLRAAVSENPTSSEYVQMAMETGLIHGDSVLLIDLQTCTRCDDCVRGCADAHGGIPRFIREGQRYRNWLIPTACYQCTDPVCMMDCPTGAISRAVGSLEVTIHGETCIGCGNCAQRCPWGNIVMVETQEKRPDGKPVELATKCDLCLTRAKGPACVQMCPHGSAVRISFKDIERVTALLR
jgi:CRP-like cAMP-binding protein/Fe-S-cluster-containing hydrogenase component 2